MTQTELAAKAGTDQSHLNKIIHTDKTKKRPSYRLAKKLGVIVGCSPLVFLEGSTADIQAALAASVSNQAVSDGNPSQPEAA